MKTYFIRDSVYSIEPFIIVYTLFAGINVGSFYAISTLLNQLILTEFAVSLCARRKYLYYYGAAIFIFAGSTQPNQTEAGRENSLVPFRATDITIRCCKGIQGT